MGVILYCDNDKCKHYFEGNCEKHLNDELITLNENGKCQNFKLGINRLYRNYSEVTNNAT